MLQKRYLTIFINFFLPTFIFAFGGGTGSKLDPFQINTPSELDSVRYFLDSSFILMNDIDLSTYLSAGNKGYNNGEYWLPIGSYAYSDRFLGKFNGNNFKITNLIINRPSQFYVGLFGCIGNNAQLINIGVEFQTGSVKGRTDVGGLVGANIGGNINYCYSLGPVLGCETTGGLVGDNQGNITCCYATGPVTGVYSDVVSDHVGGLVGSSGSYDRKCCITNCYAAGNTSSQVEIGGLVGSLNAISRDSNIISFCYATGLISGSKLSSGGLVGTGTGIQLNSYWDKETTGQLSSLNSTTGAKTTLQMKTQSTYIGWDFSTTWAISPDINNGYPYLKKPITYIKFSTIWNTSMSISATTLNNILKLSIENNDFQNIIVFVFSLSGQKILNESFKNYLEINTSHLSNGVYFIKVSGKDMRYPTIRFIKTENILLLQR